MKFKSNQEHLASKLSIVNKAVAPRSTLSLLANIKIQALKDEVRLSATNLQFSLTTSLVAQVDSPGELAVPGVLLTNFVSSLPPQKLNLVSEKGSLKIESREGWASLRGMGAEDFPVIRTESGSNAISVKSSDLRLALSGVLFATAADESRPILTGVLFESTGKNLKLVGVDGFRLSEMSLELDTPFNLKVVVPARSLNELQRLLGFSDTVSISHVKEENQIVFELGEVVLVSRVLEGTFPEYAQIIPQEFNVSGSFPVTEFKQAIQRAALFSESSSNVVRLNFKVADDNVVITAQSQDVGDTETKFDCVLTGNDSSIAFNAKYLIEALTYLESTKDDDQLVELHVKDATSHGLFRMVGNTNYLHIVMPVRLQ